MVILPKVWGSSANVAGGGYGTNLPILLLKNSVNQRLPSGPVAIRAGPLPAVGIVNSVIAPTVVILPILLLSTSVNQRAPSGPEVMPSGTLLAVGITNSVNDPAVVILPILLPMASTNQISPSGPAVIPRGDLRAVGMLNSQIVPEVVILPILFPLELPSVNQRLPSTRSPSAGKGTAVPRPRLCVRR